MKKIAAALCSILFVSSLSFGLEWGGTFGNGTSFIGKDDLKLRQTNDLGLWLSVPITKNNTIYFSTQGSYRLKIDESDNAKEEVTNILNVDVMKLSMILPLGTKAKYVMNLGRFSLSDASGYVFNQVSDGLLIKFSTQLADIQVYGGYTGLLNSKTVSILNSKKTSYSEGDNDFYSVCPKYVPFGFSMSLPSMTSNQTLILQGWGFKDLEKDIDDSSYDRWYGSLILDGYLTKNFAYNFSTVLGSENFDTLMNLTSLHYFIYPASGSTIKFGATYASGSEGPLVPFKGFTSVKAANSMSEPEYTSLFKPDFTVSILFGSKVALNLGGAAFFNPYDYFKFNGFQIDGSVLFNIFSDMQLALGGCQYIDQESDDNKTTISVSLNLAF